MTDTTTEAVERLRAELSEAHARIAWLEEIREGAGRALCAMDGMSGWPDPARPGVPLNPEQDGWHWVLLPSGETYALWWRVSAADVPVWAYGTRGVPALAFAKSGCTYLGPCLTPAEVAAIVQEEIASRYHPEMGTEWRKDGSLYQLVAAEKAAAFQRGAKAMREKAALVAAMEAVAASCQAEEALPDSPSMCWQQGRRDGSARVRDAIRALPVPEDRHEEG